MLKGLLILPYICAVLNRLAPSQSPTPWSLTPQPPERLPPPWTLNPDSTDVLLLRNRRQYSSVLAQASVDKPGVIYTILLLAGDIHSNPGPATGSASFCGFCDLEVTWDCKGICCDSCDSWFHHTCVDVGSAEYDAISRPNVAWICPRCDSTNCDSFTFRSYELDCTNYFAPLQNASIVDSIVSGDPFSPPRTSSPKVTSLPILPAEKSTTISSKINQLTYLRSTEEI